MNTNKIISYNNIKIVFFILFIVLIILIFYLNFTECFGNGPLLTDPTEITTYCNNQNSSQNYQAPSFVKLFNCDEQNIINPIPYQIVLTPFNVCPINSYLYSPTSQCILILSSPPLDGLIGWYDPSDSTNCIVSTNTVNGNDITITNKVKEKIGNLTTISGTTVKSNLISTSDTNLSNNLSQYNLLRINNINTNNINNPYLSVSTGDFITNSFTIFIVYNYVLDNPTRPTLFNTSDETNHIISMLKNMRFFGSGDTYDNRNGSNISQLYDDTSTGDISNLTLYTAIVTLNNNNINWIEHVYNKFKNSTTNFEFNRFPTTTNIRTLCNILHICGSRANFISNVNGNKNTLGTCFSGYLGEILLYNTALTPTNTTNNKNTPTSQYDNTVKYLRNKWNI
jgi:hypothetical protein